MSEEILSTIYEHLFQGANTRDDDFHFMTFCNISEDGVDARTVVLRDFEKDKKTLIFHTDVRSPKVNLIKKNPQTLCLFYSFLLKTQLRIKTLSSINYNDAFSADIWKKVGLSSRKCYLSRYSPSSEIDLCDDGLPKELQGKTPTNEESEKGKENFCVVSNKILSIDYLYLKSSGHERINFDTVSGKSSWLAP